MCIRDRSSLHALAIDYVFSRQNTVYNVEELDDLISAEIPDDDPIPVSYTHLDVYKRQF